MLDEGERRREEPCPREREPSLPAFLRARSPSGDRDRDRDRDGESDRVRCRRRWRRLDSWSRLCRGERLREREPSRCRLLRRDDRCRWSLSDSSLSSSWDPCLRLRLCERSLSPDGERLLRRRRCACRWWSFLSRSGSRVSDDRWRRWRLSRPWSWSSIENRRFLLSCCILSRASLSSLRFSAALWLSVWLMMWRKKRVLGLGAAPVGLSPSSGQRGLILIAHWGYSV